MGNTNKTFILVCSGMADDPVESLNGRTPLEVAKTPNLDLLAKNCRLGMVSFVPHSLPATPDVACFSLLGYDPQEFYTGIAPLEALAAGISLDDAHVAFRADLVTVSDEQMVDETAGGITPRESAILLKELKAKLEGPAYRFYELAGRKNILVVKDAQHVDDWDDAECAPPTAVRGQAIAKWLPKGKVQKQLTDLMSASRSALENHEVNRVRIDLKENPANQLWFWGQGRRPKLPTLKARLGVDGAFHAEALFMKGLGKALGLSFVDKLATGAWKELNVVFTGTEELAAPSTLKGKIKRIEDFDSKVVGPVLESIKRSGQPARILVTSDVLQSTSKKSAPHAQVPFLMSGPGVENNSTGPFSEKNCAQGAVSVESGHAFIRSLFKNKEASS